MWSNRQSSPRAGKLRHLVLWSRVCLITLVASIVVLPIVLLRLLASVPAAHAPRRAAPAVAPAGRPAVPATPQDAVELRLPAGSPTGGVAPSAPRSSAPDTPVESGVDALPIVEHRRIQVDDRLLEVLPLASESAEGPPAGPQRLDRSSAVRRRRVQQFGGTPRTESAVEMGLAWLAAHQSPDGLWDRLGFQNQCPADDRCAGPALRRTQHSLQAGLTGLSLLAFLGAGYTDRDGPYQDVVRRAVDALLRAQQPDGGFCVAEGMAGYNNSLATFALAEYYAMTREPRLREPLRRAVGHLARTQQELGGWDYLPRRDSGRNDTSITAWAVQALQTCAVAGIEVPHRVLINAALHFARATEADGRVWYADTGTGVELNADTLQAVYRYGPAMTAAGLACEQLLGWRIDSPACRRQRALLLGQLPSSGLARGRDPSQLHNEYYWYYGTVAMFQAGGESWERWNARLRDTLLPLQDRSKIPGGGKRHSYGSWPPYGPHWGKWGRMGGRVYTTAVCTLTLEIYYRHTPAYLEDHLLLTSPDWRALLEGARPRSRRLAIKSLREMRLEAAEPVLLELLNDTNQSVALAAAEALTSIDSPLGRPFLEKAVAALPISERAAVEQALRRAVEIASLPPTAGRVRLFDAGHQLATLELPRAYAGMEVVVQRDGREVARLRVIRRFTGRSVVLAELVGEWRGDPPRAGDRVTSR
jgi:hypothetical protein